MLQHGSMIPLRFCEIAFANCTRVAAASFAERLGGAENMPECLVAAGHSTTMLSATMVLICGISGRVEFFCCSKKRP